MRRDVAAFSAAHAVTGDGAPPAPASPAAGARHADRGAVLLRAADMVWNIARGGHVVKLRGGVLLAGPRLSAVDGDVAAAIVAVDHALRIGGVDPQVVVVPVRRPKLAIRLAPIGGFVEARVQDVNRVLALGVG